MEFSKVAYCKHLIKIYVLSYIRVPIRGSIVDNAIRNATGYLYFSAEKTILWLTWVYQILTVSLSLSHASDTDELLLKVTKPNPLDLPVSQSLMTSAVEIIETNPCRQFSDGHFTHNHA